MRISFSNVNNHFNVKYEQRQTRLASSVQSADTVSFKGLISPKAPVFINDLRNLKNMPCAFCGVKMTSNNVIKNFLNNKIYFSAEKNLNILEDSQALEGKPVCKKIVTLVREYINDAHHTERKKQTLDIIFNESRYFAKLKESMSREELTAIKKITELTKDNAYNARYTIKEIEKLHIDFHTIDKNIFEQFKILSEKYPSLKLSDILKLPEVYNYHNERLIKKQNSIFSLAQRYTYDMSSDSKEKIFKAIEDGKALFNLKDPTVTKQRRTVINAFEALAKELPEKDSMDRIIKIINKLPHSSDNVDAFMVKNSRKTSNQIVSTITYRSRNTNEHVHPHHRENDKGASNYTNYIGLCGRCNEQRRRTPYEELLKTKPEIKRNIQKQIDFDIKHINKGHLTKKYDNYPHEIKRSLAKESNNKINIKYESKLNLEKARKMREARSKANLS